MRRADKMFRVDEKFLDDFDSIKRERIKNNLEKKMISFRELTRMARKSSAYKKLLEELGTIPRRLKDGQ